MFGALTQIGTFDVGTASTPTLGDIDDDGDLDLSSENFRGITNLRNSSAAQIQVNVTEGVSIDDVSVAEETLERALRRLRSPAPAILGAFTLNYSTAIGSSIPAAPGADYVATSGTVSFTDAAR